MKRITKSRWFWFGVVGCAVVLVFLGLVHRACQRGPEFYRQALQEDGRTHLLQADAFEQQAAAVHNQLQQQGSWDLELTEAQINGWLAAGLPRRFPAALPPQIRLPRASLDNGQFHFAFRRASGLYPLVIHFSVEAFLTERENEVAIRLVRLGTGFLPLPSKSWTEALTQVVTRAGLKIRWTQEKGTPLALISVPDQWDEYPQSQLRVEYLEIENGVLRCGGSVSPADP